MKMKELFDRGEFVVSAEVGPPKGIHVDELVEEAKTYLKDVHAVNSFVNYDLPLKKVFNKISFLARYDMMTDHSNGTIDETTRTLIINDYARHRVTGGITLSLSKAFIADLRLNFEKYFYKKSGIPKESERDKIVIEFMTRF